MTHCSSESWTEVAVTAVRLFSAGVDQHVGITRGVQSLHIARRFVIDTTIKFLQVCSHET